MLPLHGFREEDTISVLFTSSDDAATRMCLAREVQDDFEGVILCHFEPIILTWFYEGPHGDDETPSVLTVEFREVGPNVTEITLTHAKIRADASLENATSGWELILDRLNTPFHDVTV